MDAKQKYKTMNHILYTLGVCLLLSLNACKDADAFYEVLDAQPEIVADYQTLYMVGDTLTIRGRLNPKNNLLIYIGNIPVEILETTTETPLNSPLTLDVAKIRITEAMGIGRDRTIRITSGSSSISAPAIEIVGDANAAVLEKQLQLVKVADIPDGALPIYSRNGKGNVYAWNNDSKKLFRISTDGNTKEVFTEANCVDAHGAFTLAEFNAGAVSTDEHYFYFSAKVNEQEQDRTLELFKLGRFDLQSGELTILNRTEYSLLRSRRTLAAAQPFEGKVGDVKIYRITALYPDSKGNVYFSLMGRFLTQLDPEGNYSYRLNFADKTLMSTMPATDALFLPLVNNPTTNNYYSTVQIHQTLPGEKLNYSMNFMDLEAMQLYSKVYNAGRITLRVTDMVTRIPMAEYPNRGRAVGEAIYATASLTSFNGNLVRQVAPYLDPISSNGKLISLYFPSEEQRGAVVGGVLCEIDFDQQKATRYAPGTLRFNDYVLESFDHLLDIDDEGMLYMTVNNRTEIVKTNYIP